MRSITCDRCGTEGGFPKVDIHEVAISHWPADDENGEAIDLRPNVDLCAQCRKALKWAVMIFLKGEKK